MKVSIFRRGFCKPLNKMASSAQDSHPSRLQIRLGTETFNSVQSVAKNWSQAHLCIRCVKNTGTRETGNQLWYERIRQATSWQAGDKVQGKQRSRQRACGHRRIGNSNALACSVRAWSVLP